MIRATSCGNLEKPTFCDMAPRLAGVLHGIGDACYSAGGFVVPLMINAMITDDPYLIRLRTRLKHLVTYLT